MCDLISYLIQMEAESSKEIKNHDVGRGTHTILMKLRKKYAGPFAGVRNIAYPVPGQIHAVFFSFFFFLFFFLGRAMASPENGQFIVVFLKKLDSLFTFISPLILASKSGFYSCFFFYIGLFCLPFCILKKIRI